MDETTRAWLAEGHPGIRYRADLDLDHRAASDTEVLAARQTLLADPLVQKLLAELAEWPGTVLNSHKSAGHAIHKLTFVADLGLRCGDPPIDGLVTRILEHTDKVGVPQILMNIPKHFGGTGADQYAWALCDAPLVLYALVKFGLGTDTRVQNAVETLVNLVRSNGWPCAASPELGTFHGPGRRDDPCPFANLVMLKLLAQFPEWDDSAAARAGVETLLSVWDNRRDQHPYLFYMGTDFCKVKAPLVWYDLLHVLDVLTQFDYARSDPRLKTMLAVLRDKADAQGRFTPESIWTAWKDWDMGQKKQPSRWLTFYAERIFNRMAA